MDINSEIRFSELCKLFEKISNANTQNRKSEIFLKFFTCFKSHAEKFKKENGPDCNTSFYSILRLFLTSYDRIYGIKEHRMSLLYKKLFYIDPNSADGKKMGFQDKNSDYADTIYSIIKARCKQESDLTIFSVNQYLDVISENSKKTEEVFSKIILTATAQEQKWIIRIILKKLSLNFSNNRIFNAYDSRAKELYAQYTDIKQLCEIIEGTKTVEEIGHIELFKAVRPMLCERININRFDEIIKHKDFYAETKMDGDRFQIHMNNNIYRYYSRNAKDYSYIYGESPLTGSLSQFFPKLLNSDVRNFIIDGEMMVWNKEKNKYLVKGDNIDVKALKSTDPVLRPCFCIFDILYYNGKCLVNIPYAERVRIILTKFSEQIGVLMICKRQKMLTKGHIIDFLNNAIDSNEEGIVLKTEDSIYKPGERNGGWYKIKTDYIDGMTQEFDFVIIGGFYTKKKDFLESFLLGVKMESVVKGLIFYSVGTVRSGLTKNEWVDLNNRLKPHWNIATIKTTEVASENIRLEWIRPPDIWINPKNSIILQVKASELFKSNSFRTPFTLRFPRIMKIRNDKFWEDCCTLKEFQNFYPDSSMSVGKITKRHITIKDTTAVTKRLKLPQIKTVVNSYTFSENECTIIKDLCKGLEFCVISTSKRHPTIKELELLILQYGGKIVKHPGFNTHAIVGSELTFHLRQLIAAQKYDIVSVDWLLRALNENVNELIDFRPNDMISKTLKLESELNLKYDKFGDSYLKKITMNELTYCMASIESIILPKFTNSELYQMEELLMENENKNFFRLLTGYFHLINNSKLILVQNIFRSRGGAIVEKKSDIFTHIFIDLKTFKKSKIKNFNTNNVKVLNYEWIIECDKNAVKINYDKFQEKIV